MGMLPPSWSHSPLLRRHNEIVPEPPMNENVRNLTCEFLATFAFTFVGAGAIVTTTWQALDAGLLIVALAHGVVLSIVVTATMKLSGGHVNPAVSIAMLLTGRMKVGAAISYILAQCLGATLGGVLLVIIFNSLGASPTGMTGQAAIEASKLGTPNFGSAVPLGIALLVEILLTFLLLFAIFGTAVDSRSPNIGGFGVGLAVMVDILVGGPITGAAMNPARTIGPLIAGGSATSDLWSQHWLYWVGPIIGAVVAAFVYDLLILGRKPGSTPRA